MMPKRQVVELIAKGMVYAIMIFSCLSPKEGFALDRHAILFTGNTSGTGINPLTKNVYLVNLSTNYNSLRRGGYLADDIHVFYTHRIGEIHEKNLKSRVGPLLREKGKGIRLATKQGLFSLVDSLAGSFVEDSTGRTSMLQ
jgi:hypothetical protein